MCRRVWGEPKLIAMRAAITTRLGALFNMDCVKLLGAMRDESVDCVFADPPFNLGKVYGDQFSDSLTPEEYIAWSREWLAQCIRVLKPGGSLFVYNIPRWQIQLGAFLMEQNQLVFRNWIAVQMKNNFPRGNQLYPAHYGLLYFTKGAARTFHRDAVRYPMPLCRHCGKPIPDWGGYKNTLHERGVNLSDIWTDTSPQRHRNTKTRAVGINELDPRIPTRAILLSTNEGDVVFDPFGGGGSTYRAAEEYRRHWIGAEVGPLEAIAAKLTQGGSVEFGVKPDDAVLRTLSVPVVVPAPDEQPEYGVTYEPRPL